MWQTVRAVKETIEVSDLVDVLCSAFVLSNSHRCSLSESTRLSLVDVVSTVQSTQCSLPDEVSNTVSPM